MSSSFNPRLISNAALWSASLAISGCLLGGCNRVEPKPAISKNEIKKLQDVQKRELKFEARAKIENYRSQEEIIAQRLHEIKRGIHYKTLISGPSENKQIALTFDDGPHADGTTAALLKVLKETKVKVTFFVVGQAVEQHPELVMNEFKQGHLIANHTYQHVNLTNIPADEIAMQYRACSDIVYGVTHHRPKFCRPPGGQYDGAVIKAATHLDMTTALWTDNPEDYTNPGADVIKRRVLEGISNGGVILLHDGVKQTIEMLPELIKELRAMGYTFVLVDQLKAANDKLGRE